MLFAINPLIITLLSYLGISSFGLKNYKKQFDAINYGTKVNVNGYDMSVSIAGKQHNQTIVFLPGLGIPSPVIQYKTITEPLSQDFKVITIEPFGYGISDITKRKRTTKNIVSEIHTCLKKLGVNKYYLMAHSLGGIYSVAYANKYPKEVSGFIGLENTPSNHEFESLTSDDKLEMKLGRVIAKHHLWRFTPEEEKQQFMYLDPNFNYTEEDKKNYDIIFGYSFSNENIIDENDNLKKNVESVKDLTFKCPSLMFVASINCENVPGWKPGHEAMVGDPDNSEVIELEGSHMIYMDQKQSILDKVKEWIK
ncbi:hypothetical protein PIROE2DRAFT_4808 [Piromyces sp. E2]|nr:hypothetical protein PIROE2DRAFT_4808 [Piromyces sp. E2]|eukprot:OUM67644.1 hypothetical protein PIROE2DRAFT_4808 [Piromyces sp. E2]